MEILVIADDFTGANDTGVQFYHRGFSVDVIFDLAEVQTNNTDVIVVNTNSRSLLIENAQREVYQVCEKLNADNYQIYKKVDSTLRGNIGAELEACLRATKRDLVIFCSALPAAQRVIKDGICLVHNVPLLDTEFATDPKTPITSSSIKEIISTQTSINVVEASISTLSEAEFLHCIELSAGKETIFVIDAESEADLKQLAGLVQKIERPLIVAGSSGLARYVFPRSVTMLPMLFVVGSMSEQSKKQVNTLLMNNSVAVIELNTRELIENQNYVDEIAQQAFSLLSQNKHLVLKTDSSFSARINIEEICKLFQLDRVSLGEKVCESLSVIVEATLTRIDSNISGLFLTGGDIAMQVARQLNLNNYRIAGEVEVGVPYGYFADEKFAHIPVITKAGAFGSDNVLQHSLEFIESLTKEY
ncbi:hypothetical protein QV08_05800 [Gallibacterium salpingitidis]|uniref:four-carbon acid sugar kinase family protein n=1 Tax=Gallibacterium salpingitidis TaxID=505341 RepID=UPI000805BA09|nr:four-carbon acid sugar kinase family protein [Gallibacterium salpingitidis]OBX08156.1 hypothetical protein QV08_05800 [Gallibacterium salpingitidis]